MPSATTAEDYAEAIRLALAGAEYPPADDLIIEQAAARLYASAGDLDLAYGDGTVMPRSTIGLRVSALLLHYKAALEETGRPERIAARLLQWARWADAQAAWHDRQASDYDLRADAFRRQGRADEAAREALIVKVNHDLAAEERAGAERLRARALKLVVKEAA